MKKLNSINGTIAGILLAACGVTHAGNADAAEAVPAPAAAAVSPHTFGVGYKIGNGLGFVGADVVVGLGEHLSLGLQANYFAFKMDNDETATGYGGVPFVQYRFFKPRSSPYVSAGPVYAHLGFNNVTASATGALANVGWEWVWARGLSLNVGAGIAHLGAVKATDGITSIEKPGGTFFNIESALRYYFF